MLTLTKSLIKVGLQIKQLDHLKRYRYSTNKNLFKDQDLQVKQTQLLDQQHNSTSHHTVQLLVTRQQQEQCMQTHLPRAKLCSNIKAIYLNKLNWEKRVYMVRVLYRPNKVLLLRDRKLCQSTKPFYLKGLEQN